MCQIRNFKVPKWHFEIAPIKFEQLVSNPHELFFILLTILLFCGILTCVFVIKKQSQMAL